MKLTKTFFEDIRGLITSARATVARGVDLVQVHMNFEIGRRIVEQEQKGKGRAAYGQEVIRALGERLTEEFGKGYSTSNLAYMRSFFLAYPERISIFQTVSGKLAKTGKPRTATGKSSPVKTAQTVTGQWTVPNESALPRPFTLGWSHYVFLLGIKNPDERSFYEIEAAAQNWTVRELRRQFDSSLYERLALSRDKKGIRKLAKEGQFIGQPADILKEPLVLEFLGLHESHRYSESSENHPTQRRQHPRARIPARPAQQSRVATQTPRMVQGGGTVNAARDAESDAPSRETAERSKGAEVLKTIQGLLA